ncbi:hypothetical protein BGX38DRAFT_245842 [Terfezia claveryi]|nr:hypothetical protein BGX38DRAFT_245842 [Terfezia claveryi]
MNYNAHPSTLGIRHLICVIALFLLKLFLTVLRSLWVISLDLDIVSIGAVCLLCICNYWRSKRGGVKVWLWMVEPWGLGRYSTCLFYSIFIHSHQFVPFLS